MSDARPGGGRAHWAEREWKAALGDGRAVRGVLHVNRRDAQQACVRRGWRMEGGAARDVVVCGSPALNRAFHGDTVVRHPPCCVC